MKYLRQFSVVQTDRTVLVIMGDVFPLSAEIFAGIFWIVIAGLCVVKFWSSLWRGEYLLFISKPMSLDFHFLSTVLFSVFLEWTCLFLKVAIAIYIHIYW